VRVRGRARWTCCGRWSARGCAIPGPEELDALLRDLRDDLRDVEDGGIPGFPHDTSGDDEPPWL
jgi:hypothetical protein